MPKRYRVEITSSAERDAIGIYEYIELESPERAAKWFAEIERQMRTLSQLPTRCPMIPESEEIGAEYRQLIWGMYRTIFRIEGNIVLVVRVIHGAQLLESGTLETSGSPDPDARWWVLGHNLTGVSRLDARRRSFNHLQTSALLETDNW